MPEEKKKSWFHRHWVVTIILIGFFVLVGVLGILTEGIGEQAKNNSGLTVNSVENQNSVESDEPTKCTGSTFEKICINKKIDGCTKLCAGEDIDIPAVKTDCYSSCYQIYYYGGETDLDKYIKEFG